MSRTALSTTTNSVNMNATQLAATGGGWDWDEDDDDDESAENGTANEAAPVDIAHAVRVGETPESQVELSSTPAVPEHHDHHHVNQLQHGASQVSLLFQ